MTDSKATTETRQDRRRRRNREALIRAAYEVVSRKGIDATTVHDITEHADVGLGTAYNYFSSKEELILAAIEQGMGGLAKRIGIVTDTFDDTALVYAFGIRTLMDTATTDQRWQWLLRRSELISDAIFRCFGPNVMRDLENAKSAGRYKFDNVELVWRQASWAIVGTSVAICERKLTAEDLTEAVVNLLAMVGMPRDEAWAIASHQWPPLPTKAPPA